MKVKIDGLDELVKTLDRLDSMEAEEGFQNGIVDGALLVIQEAKDLVPVDSGDLRDSLHIGGYTKLTPEYRKVGSYGALKKPIGKGKTFGVFAGSTLPYAHLVELGTKRTRAKPFLRPAADTKQDEVVKAVEQAIQAVIEGR